MTSTTFSDSPGRHPAQIAEVVRVDGNVVSVRSSRHAPSDVARHGSDADERDAQLITAAAKLIYSELYARPRRRVRLDRGDPGLIAKLSRANTGTGTWDPGWTVAAIRDDHVIVARNGLHVLADRREILADTIDVGCACGLRIAKEQLRAAPGYYFAVGDASAKGRMNPWVRVYVNLVAAGACEFIAALTSRLNARHTPFRAKILVDERAFARADAAVVYLDRDDYLEAMPALREIAHDLAHHVIDEPPLFARRVARGFAVAEDPGRGESFGLHRCRAIARALVHCARRRTSAVLANIAREFEQAEIDLERPYLRRGSEDVYAPW